MSGSNWSLIFKVRKLGEQGWFWYLLSILGISLAATIVIWGSSKQAEYERAASEHTAKYQQYSYGPALRACLSKPMADKANCVNDARNAERENARDERDLEAQRVTALWTYVMGVAAITGMLLSAIGVGLVWTTFRETRESNKIAKHAQRPWISIDAVPNYMKEGNGNINWECTMFFKNIGLTVARNFYFQYEIFFILPDRLSIDRAQWEKWGNPVHKSRSVIMPGESSGHLGSKSIKKTDIDWLDMGSDAPRLMMPLIAVSAFYQMTDSDGWHRTDRAFRIGKRGRGSDCVAIEETVNRLDPPLLTIAPYGLTLAD